MAKDSAAEVPSFGCITKTHATELIRDDIATASNYMEKQVRELNEDKYRRSIKKGTSKLLNLKMSFLKANHPM
jgi:hypothetical protein